MSKVWLWASVCQLGEADSEFVRELWHLSDHQEAGLTSASAVVTLQPPMIGFHVERQSFVGSRRLTRVLSYQCSFQYHQQWEGCVWIGIPRDPARMVQDWVLLIPLWAAEEMSIFSQLSNPHIFLLKEQSGGGYDIMNCSNVWDCSNMWRTETKSF